jgi:chemotaxis protein CheD
MIDYTLKIGDVATSGSPARYTCFGLGSCIGLFIHDRTKGCSAGAHIFLPETMDPNNQGGKYFDAKTAVDEILRRFADIGSDKMSLRAKLVGGANVTQLKSQEGIRNTQAVISLLREHRIFVAAMDVGGSWCRTVTFDSVTGSITVRIPELSEFKVI